METILSQAEELIMGIQSSTIEDLIDSWSSYIAQAGAINSLKPANALPTLKKLKLLHRATEKKLGDDRYGTIYKNTYSDILKPLKELLEKLRPSHS